MNTAIIGTGYVGLVTGACLAETGIMVTCMDTDEEKVKKLQAGIIPIYEPGLQSIVEKNTASKRLTFTSSIHEAVQNSEVIFIAVGTPPQENDSADLSYVFKAAQEIAFHMMEYKLIVVKSTVPVGTCRRLKEKISNNLKSLDRDIPFDIASNPEFLREGSAVGDFLSPDRIVFGTETEKAAGLLKEIYNGGAFPNTPVIATNMETSEMIKYASNAFLATKVSFINEVANICELGGADVKTVSEAMGLDRRIGSKFLNPGPGYGGSCFPKDTKAFVGIGKTLGYKPKIVKAVIDVNSRQRQLMFRKIRKAMGSFRGKTVTVLGIAFKPETDDIRESPALFIVESLLKNKTKVKLYDPKAMENVKFLYPHLDIQYCSDIDEACNESDCVILATEWGEFQNLDFIKLKNIVRKPLFMDLRNVYEPDHVRKAGFIYHGVGRL